MIVGAHENNLKYVDVRIPQERLVVFTRVSGSGKSSLVFDTIAAEAMRRVERDADLAPLLRLLLVRLLLVTLPWTAPWPAGASPTVDPPIAGKIQQGLKRIADLGLEYLNLNRVSTSLSGGETQRLKMVRSSSNTTRASSRLPTR